MAPSAFGAGESHIPVTLFGQPCTLKGPTDAATLKAIHAISPEQIAPPFDSSRTVDQTHRAQDRLATATGLPSGLDRYRDQLSAELKAQLAFLTGLEAARKAGNSAPFLTAVKPYLKPSRQRDFEALAAKLSTNRAGSAQQAATVEQLFDAYGDAYQTGTAAAGDADGTAGNSSGSSEEEFHRALRKLNIQYACNFDVEDGAGESGEDDSAPRPATPAKKH